MPTSLSLYTPHHTVGQRLGVGALDMALYALPTVSAVVGGASGCALIRGQVNCAVNRGTLHTLLSTLGTTVLCLMTISISSVHNHLYVKHWTCYTYKHGHTFYPTHRHSYSNMSDVVLCVRMV